MRHTIVPAGPLLILGLIALVSAAAVAEPGPRPLSLDDLGSVRFGWGDPPPAPEPPAPVAFERSISAPAALTATDLGAIAFRPGASPAGQETQVTPAIAEAPVPIGKPSTTAQPTSPQPLELDLEALGGVGIVRRN